jgi:hypothetical protein
MESLTGKKAWRHSERALRWQSIRQIAGDFGHSRITFRTERNQEKQKMGRNWAERHAPRECSRKSGKGTRRVNVVAIPFDS